MTPPPSLMRELREVESDADALAAELARAQQQYLPSDFPAEQLQELLVELQSLPLGTAEGCRRPLEYARGRLPAIRRQFIKTEEESRQSPVDASAPPPLTRGMTIDVRIGALVNSVTTALDEYRALAFIQDEDAADTAPSQEIDVTSPDVANAMSVSERIERILGERVSELERITRPDSVTADNFKRQIRDTRRLLSLARIELRMPAFVPLWYRKTIETVRDYPRILRATATAIRMGVDVARPMVDAWNSFEHGFSGLVLESIERVTNGLLAVAQKWEVERAGGRSESAATTGLSPGFDYAEARTMVLRGEAPPPPWRPWITALEFSQENLHDLAPLAGLTALQSLDLVNTQVSDVAPLVGLTALQHLSLNGTQVSDVAPLAGLTTLLRLSLNGTQVSDVAPLAGLTALQHLSLNGTQVSDVAPLAGLTTLLRLSLYGTQVSDVAPLADLTALQRLDLDRTQVSDVAPLVGLTALLRLSLYGTQVSDVAPLAGLTALQHLDLHRTQVSNFAPLAGLTALQYLDLSGTQVSDVAPLAGLTALQSLDLNSTLVSDFAPLAGLTALRFLYVSDPQVSDLAPLEHIRGLQIMPKFSL